MNSRTHRWRRPLTEKLITRKQLKRLQTLWGLLARHEGFDPKDRGLRLAWVAHALARDVDAVRPLGSFRELSEAEARTAIDKIQECLPAELVTHKKKRKGKPAPPASSAQLARIAELQTALGMTAERFDAWLRSSHSPLRTRHLIRTTFDAGAVIRALENMLRRKVASGQCSAISEPNTDHRPPVAESEVTL